MKEGGQREPQSSFKKLKNQLIMAEKNRPIYGSSMSSTPMQNSKESTPVLDFTKIARNIYSNEHRDSLNSIQSCEVLDTDS